MQTVKCNYTSEGDVRYGETTSIAQSI